MRLGLATLNNLRQQTMATDGTASPKAAGGTAEDIKAVTYTRSSFPLADALAAFFIGNMFANFVLGIAIVLFFTWRWHVQYVLLPLVVLYYINVRFSKAQEDGRSRTWTRAQAAFHKYIISYFRTTVITEGGVLPDKSYIFCFSPHGIHGFGLMTITDESPEAAFYRAYPHMRGRVVGLVASVLFWVPGVRELFLTNGYRDASAHVAQRALREGNSVALIVGGEAESLLSSPGTDRVVIDGRKRKGVFRLALRTGAELVPVYMFKNADTYSTSHFASGFRRWLSKRFQICLPLWWGRFFTPVPYDVPLTVAYGKPVPMPKLQVDEKGHPTDACIEEYRTAYKQALLDLFERHKAKAGYPACRKLEFHASD